jgi:DNA-binding SARP family transcriptional activator
MPGAVQVRIDGIPASTGRVTVSGDGLRVYALGGFRVERGADVLSFDQGVSRPAQKLFKWLLTRRTRRLPREETFEALWPTSDTPGTLRGAILRLRRALEPDVDAGDSILDYDADAIWIRRDADVWVDADAFEHLISEAVRADDPADLLEEADRLYAGEYLPDDVYDDWAIQRREALANLWKELQFNLSRSRERRGDVPGAIRALQRLLEQDRCDERAANELMLLLARSGRRSEALRVYQRLVESLREELAAEPSAGTKAVYHRVSTGEAGPLAAGRAPDARPQTHRPAASPAVRVLPPEPPRPPFFPSYPFPEPDTLVGREAELRALTHALERGRTGGQVVVLGAPAGSGKSTVVGSLVREAARTGYLCLAGGSYDSESPLPFGPVRDALADYLLDEPADRLRADLADVLADLAHVVPELRYHLDLGESPAGPRDTGRLYGAVHAFLSSLAASRPVLLCLEDLHAADGATIALIHYLARRTRRLPLVLVCTYRSDEASPPLTRVLLGLSRERLA